jgi:hypothetical protein
VLAIAVGVDVYIVVNPQQIKPLSDPGTKLAGMAFFSVPLGLMVMLFWWMATRNGFGTRIDPEAILAELRSPDEGTRASSAKRLRLLAGPDANAAALASVTDSVPAVRYYALRSLVIGHPFGLRSLAELLARTDAAGNEARTAVLGDLANLGGADSPLGVLDTRASRWEVRSNLFLAVRVAIDLSRTESPDLARQMLVELARQKRMPDAVLARKDPTNASKTSTDEEVAVVWPHRCYKCGAPNPTVEVAKIQSHTENMHTRRVSFRLPACVECAANDRSKTAFVHVDLDRVSISDLHPDFVADLLNRNREWAV